MRDPKHRTGRRKLGPGQTVEVSALGIPLQLQNTASPRTGSSHLGKGIARRHPSSSLCAASIGLQRDGEGFFGPQALNHPNFPSEVGPTGLVLVNVTIGLGEGQGSSRCSICPLWFSHGGSILAGVVVMLDGSEPA